jgi:DNA-binding helix-hairpin-helix protein with protein kinase domain
MLTEKDLPIQVQLQSNGQEIILLKKFASGGEGFICSIKGNNRFVVKIYTKFVPYEKLKVMLLNKPIDPMASQNHTSIAWPEDIVLDTSGKPIGYLMPKAGTKEATNERLFTLNKLLLPLERKKELPDFSYKDIAIVAYNFCLAVQELHASGYIIGDLNESNALITDDAFVTLIDTDSFQVKSGMEVFRCTVGKAEYTSQELQGKRFDQVDRSIKHDNFSLAVLVFQLLMNGWHPFSGKYLGTTDQPSLIERIKTGTCPFFQYYPDWTLPPASPSISLLPPKILTLFKLCFVDGHSLPQKRPNAAEWVSQLFEMNDKLAACSVNTLHYYGNHMTDCPWCKLSLRNASDPFPFADASRRGTGQIKRERPGLPTNMVSARSQVFNPSILGKKQVFTVTSSEDIATLIIHTSLFTLGFGFIFWFYRRLAINFAPELQNWLLTYPLFEISNLAQLHKYLLANGVFIALVCLALFYKFKK